MKDNRCIRIVVHPLEGSPWEYVACYASELLQAFAEMVRKAFGKRCRTGQIDFEMSPASGLLHSRALQDVMEHAFCA